MLKELANGHDTFIQTFDFLKVKKTPSDSQLVVTDDLVLSQSFDGKMILWAIGPNAKLLPHKMLKTQDFLPPISQLVSF